MDPVTAILAAASAAGAIFGGARKHIDINWLKQKFGAQAVTQEALELFNAIINSPSGQAIMSSAAEQGQQFSRDISRQAAQAGLAGPGGGTSGAGIFATSAAEGASSALQRDVASQLYQSSLPIAQEMVNQRMQAYLADFQSGGVPTQGAQLWQNIGRAAGTIGSMLPQKTTTTTPTSVTAPTNIPSPSAVAPAETPIFSGMDIRRRLPSTAAVLPTFRRLERFPNSFGLVQPFGRR